MTSQPYRYEFRHFAPELRATESLIRTYTALSRYRESHEIYLLLPERQDLNLKIRDGALELKSLHHRYRDIEQWRPTFHLEFPIDTQTLEHHMKAYLSFDGDGWPAHSCSKQELVERVQHNDINGAVAGLFKKRSGFEIEDCLVEIVELYINGAITMSVAIESPQVEAVMALRNQLKLDHLQNTGYTRALERVLGRIPLEKGVFHNAFEIHEIDQEPHDGHQLQQALNG